MVCGGNHPIFIKVTRKVKRVVMVCDVFNDMNMIGCVVWLDLKQDVP